MICTLVMLHHTQLHIDLRQTVHKEVLYLVALSYIEIVHMHKCPIRNVLIGHTPIKELFIGLTEKRRHLICPLVAAHEMPKECFDEKYLLLRELRLHKRHTALREIAFGNEACLL